MNFWVGYHSFPPIWCFVDFYNGALSLDLFIMLLIVDIEIVYDDDMIDQIEEFDLSMWIMIRIH